MGRYSKTTARFLGIGMAAALAVGVTACSSSDGSTTAAGGKSGGSFTYWSM